MTASPRKGLEEIREEVFGNANARVLNLNRHGLLGAGSPKGHRSARLRKLEGVAEQVVGNAVKHRRVEPGRQGLLHLRAEREAVLVGLRLENLGGPQEFICKIDRLSLRFDGARLKLREVEHRVDGVEQAIAAALDQVDALLTVLRRLPAQQFGEIQNRRERGAHVVAHVRQERRLEAAGLLGLFFGRLQFLLVLDLIGDVVNREDHLPHPAVGAAEGGPVDPDVAAHPVGALQDVPLIVDRRTVAHDPVERPLVLVHLLRPIERIEGAHLLILAPIQPPVRNSQNGAGRLIRKRDPTRTVHGQQGRDAGAHDGFRQVSLAAQALAGLHTVGHIVEVHRESALERKRLDLKPPIQRRVVLDELNGRLFLNGRLVLVLKRGPHGRRKALP